MCNFALFIKWSYLVKKFKLFLVSSVLAVGSLSNPVNAVEPDEKESGSKSPAVTILDLDGNCISKILKNLPLRDVANFALTSKKAGQVPYRPIWFQKDGKYGKASVSFDRWSLMVSPLVAAARHKDDFDQYSQDPEWRDGLQYLLPSTLDLRLAVMDNLPSFHSQKNFTFQINGEQWHASCITFLNGKHTGYINVSDPWVAKGHELTMANVLNILEKPCVYNASTEQPKKGTAQFCNWGTVDIKIVK